MSGQRGLGAIALIVALLAAALLYLGYVQTSSTTSGRPDLTCRDNWAAASAEKR
jgi:hypothetical protein